MIITHRLTKEMPILIDSQEEKIININTISLESADEKFPIDIFCENKRKSEVFKICSLKKGSQEVYSTELILDLHDFKDKYELFLKTKCKNVVVNIIGYYDLEEESEEKEETKKKSGKRNKRGKRKKGEKRK